MAELFDSAVPPDTQNLPLAVRMRPRSLAEFVGQAHLLGEGKLLRKLIEADALPTLILYGPPGCGKTALVMLIARTTGKHFHHLNAVTATVADVREVIVLARRRKQHSGQGTILFLDEIAHFNKTQQDALLRDVEEGTIVLLGATTHNPYFYINSPLLSRGKVFELKPPAPEELVTILERALADSDRGLGAHRAVVEADALRFIARSCEGDVRRALNTLEIAVLTARSDQQGVRRIDAAAAAEALGGRQVLYDRDEEEHYDTISAFIKSMRGSDPDAALYWMAVMIAAGEDPRFIARRIVICAAEDVGNADPQALLVADAAFRAVEVIGWPEAKIVLSQAAIYVATSPKSNAAYRAIAEAESAVVKERRRPVPAHLRQAGYKGAESLGRGAGYLYPHDYPDHFVPQEYLPAPKKFYTPSDQGYEKKIAFFLNHLDRLRKDHEKRAEERNTPTKKRPAGG